MHPQPQEARRQGGDGRIGGGGGVEQRIRNIVTSHTANPIYTGSEMGKLGCGWRTWL